MYPILILRSELVCLVILVFLHFTSRSYKLDSESNSFRRILHFALIHVVFDILTVLTVNNTDTVPNWVNWIFHFFFYISAMLYSAEIANYAVALVYPDKAKKLYAVGHGLITLFICSLSFLRITYVPDVGTWSSAGTASIGGYGLAFSFFIIALGILFTHFDKLSTSVKSALIPMMLVLMITEVSQVIWRSLLFTGGAITIVTVGFFFSLENPVDVFRKKAMTDALTGMRSRSSYEEDMEKYDQSFQQNPGNEYTFVFCDLNDLRSVNNRFGHAEGDTYITLIASAIRQCMKDASAIYRIGGDEFIIFYHKATEETVESELKALQAACIKSSEGLEYTASVSVGYAFSSPTYRSLHDVVKTADYAMYRNKAIYHGEVGAATGAQLNYTGLTDKIFDAMCASNDKYYPFITNLDTNVTRISPNWKEYFGLDREFFSDFVSAWREHIHPDDYQGYVEDVAAVLNGHRRYHNYDYLAKNAEGEYVEVSCHGSVYRDSSSGSSFFVGYIINHGPDEKADELTGLHCEAE